MSIRRHSGDPGSGRDTGSDARTRERKLSKRIWDRIGLNFGAKSGARARAERDKAPPRPTAKRAEALARLLFGDAAEPVWGNGARLGGRRTSSTNLEAARAAATWAAQLAALITSDAFRRDVLAALAAGAATPASQAEPAPPEELLAAALKKVDDPLEPSWVAADVARLKEPFPSWEAFWAVFLGLQGVRWAAEQALPPEERALYFEQVSRARALLLAAPGSAVVLRVDVDPDTRRGGDTPRALVVSRVFGAGPRRMCVRARGMSDGALIAYVNVTSPEGGPGGVEMKTVLPFDLNADLSGDMHVEVADAHDGASQGPGGRLSSDFSLAAEAMTLRRIDAVLAAGDWDGAEQMIDSAISRAPDTLKPRVAAVEMALWRRNLERAAALLKAADVPADAEWVRLEAALSAARAPELSVAPLDAAAGGAKRPEDLSPEDLSPANQSPAAMSPAALGTAVRTALSPLAASQLAAAPAGPRAAAVSMLSSTPAALLACAARLEPAALPWLKAEWALGVARTAAQQDQHGAALAWANAALSRSEASPQVRDGVISLCTELDTPAAVSLALAQAQQEEALRDETHKGLYLAALEARLCELDPRRDRAQLSERLNAERAAAEMASKEQAAKASEADPFDSSHAMYLAEARALTSDLRGAVELLTKLVAQAPADLGRRLSLLAALEQLEAPERVIDTAEPALFDETAFLFHARALRASGQLEAAWSALDARGRKQAPRASLELRLETARAAFQLGDFISALTAAEAALEARPGSRAARRLAVASAVEAGAGDTEALERAAAHLEAWESNDPVPAPEDAVPASDRLDIPLYRATLAHAVGDPETGLGQLNALWRRLGLREVFRRPSDSPYVEDPLAELTVLPAAAARPGENAHSDTFDADTFDADAFDPDDQPPSATKNGPLVSVVMATHNAAPFLKTALSSLFAQSHQNLEVIAVDDASDDDSLDMLRVWAAGEPRLRVVPRTENGGMFVARNVGLQKASGVYVAFQDADDWSHPDRLARCLAVLEAQPDLIAVTADSIRVDSAARPLIRPNAEISGENWSSLVCRRAPALERVGFFDSVRAEADEDFIRRLELAFGRWAVARMREPLLLARDRPGAVDADVAIGVARGGPGTFRRAYRAAAARWRDEIAAGRASARLPFPLETRPFKVPAALSPERN